MAQNLYSPSTLGFYNTAVHEALPGDAIAITVEEYGRLLAGLNSGQTIDIVDGAPVLADAPPTAPPPATLSKIDFCRALYTAQILPADLVVDAARGKWPATFEAAIASLPEAEQVDAKLAWAGATHVSRTAPLFLSLLAFFAAAQGLSDTQAETLGDQIFGVTHDPV